MTTKLNKIQIKCAVFDLDGTLLNTIKTINYYLNFALNKNGLSSVDEEACKSFVGDGAVKLIERALVFLSADCDRYFTSVFTDYNEAYNSDPYYLTEPYEGIKDMINSLKASGIILAVLSNKPNFATVSTVTHFFGESFAICRGAISGVPLKPAPDALFAILDELGVPPTESAYIGDSEPDILTAKNADVALPISVSWGFRTKEQLLYAGASLIIDNPLELTKNIKQCV